MKKIISVISLTLIGFTSYSMAADADKGEKIFTANCTGCHAKGMNHIAEGKSLSQEDLKINNRHSSAAIVDLITNGKSPMPAFGKSGAISVSDIENVAAYVLKKADAGW
ncbi:MAG: Cytochrome c6 [Pseudomonadota bacterium]|jgi:cytochrome c6